MASKLNEGKNGQQKKRYLSQSLFDPQPIIVDIVNELIYKAVRHHMLNFQ